MSSRVPTVRVKHPLTGGMMTINASDLADHHELWSEQALDFDPTALERARSRPVDPALRDALAAFGAKVVSFALEQRGDSYQAMSDVARLEAVSRVDVELDDSVVKFRAFKRESDELRRRESEAQAAREAADQAASRDVDPAVTPGPGPQSQDTSLVGEGDQGQDPGPGDDQDDQSGPGDEGDHGESEDLATDTHSLGVEESARGKFYVTRGGRRVSRGFSTAEEAERTRANMEAAS